MITGTIPLEPEIMAFMFSSLPRNSGLVAPVMVPFIARCQRAVYRIAALGLLVIAGMMYLGEAIKLLLWRRALLLRHQTSTFVVNARLKSTANEAVAAKRQHTTARGSPVNRSAENQQ